MALTLQRSASIAGTDSLLKVGKRTYSLPGDVRVARSALNGSKVVYVLDPRNKNRVHCLTEKGEVLGIPENLLRAVRGILFGVDDDNKISAPAPQEAPS